MLWTLLKRVDLCLELAQSNKLAWWRTRTQRIITNKKIYIVRQFAYIHRERGRVGSFARFFFYWRSFSQEYKPCLEELASSWIISGYNSTLSRDVYKGLSPPSPYRNKTPIHHYNFLFTSSNPSIIPPYMHSPCWILAPEPAIIFSFEYRLEFLYELWNRIITCLCLGQSPHLLFMNPTQAWYQICRAILLVLD